MADQPFNPMQHPLVRAVASAWQRRCRVRGQARLLVAVSGGADSVALLHALNLLAPRRGFGLTLGVGHVQHHLRDPASEDDAGFVEVLAEKLDLPFFRADLDLAATAAEPANLEARARRQRYAALATLAGTFDAELIATAHHGDDQLETLLMRLLRGSGVAGLRGIAWHRRLRSRDGQASPSVALIRPMLGSTHAAAVELLQSLGQPWREDHTNDDVDRRRARLRRDVLPVLRELRGDAAAMAVALGDHAREVHLLVEAEIDRHHERVERDDHAAVLDRGEARLMPRVVLAGLLRRLLAEQGAPGDRLSRRMLSPILRAVRDRAGGERRFDLTGGATVTVTRDEVILAEA